MAKHPSDGSKNSDVGHAWVYIQDGDRYFEGGFSAETGRLQPTYLQGVGLLSERGDLNPARYLFATQKDGHLELGSGGHKPTYAAGIDITESQAEAIFSFIDNYPYESYRLTGDNCATFAADIAALVGIHLEVREMVEIDPVVTFRGETTVIWTDPTYSRLFIATPDRLEQSLWEHVQSGKLFHADIHGKSHDVKSVIHVNNLTRDCRGEIGG